MPETKTVMHHDDPPCYARLKNGYCPECRFTPDMQSLALYTYCVACDKPLNNMTCPTCGRHFEVLK